MYTKSDLLEILELPIDANWETISTTYESQYAALQDLADTLSAEEYNTAQNVSTPADYDYLDSIREQQARVAQQQNELVQTYLKLQKYFPQRSIPYFELSASAVFVFVIICVLLFGLGYLLIPEPKKADSTPATKVMSQPTEISSGIVVPTQVLPTQVLPTQVPATDLPPTQNSTTPTTTPTATPQPSPTVTATWSPVTGTTSWLAVVLVPSGCFNYPATPTQFQQLIDTGNWSLIQNQPLVCFDQPFWITRYEITQAEYNGTSASETGNYPQTLSNQSDAATFCQSVGGRLPTAREWTYAAAGPLNYQYPWGNSVTMSDTYFSNSKTALNGKPSQIGMFPNSNSWVGAFDMTGNVWEWTADSGPLPDSYIIKGGAYYSEPESLSFNNYAEILATPLASYKHTIGFWCVFN